MAKFEKGKSGNPKGRPAEVPTGKIMDVSFSATAQNMPETPLPPTTENQLTTQEWIDWGTDNLFPNAVAELNRKSPIHSGILNWKRIYLSGDGFNTGKDKKLSDWIASCNAFEENFKAVMSRIIKDKQDCGNAFMEIVKLNGQFFVYHTDYTTCRLGKDKKTVKIYGDWKNVKKDQIKSVGLYPNFTPREEGGEHSIVHFKDYSPGFFDYGVASWIAGMDAAGIAYKTNKWNISRLDNSFSSSGVLVVEGNISPAESKQMKTDFKKEFTGEEKQGKVMFIVKAVGGGETKFTPFTSTNEGEWLQLHTQSKEDLVSVHNWFITLTGSSNNSSWTKDQVKIEYAAAMATVISEEQNNLLQIIQRILKKEASIEAKELTFIQKPLNLQSDLDPKAVLTKNEQREVFGYERLEEQITQALSGAQVDSLVNILTACANGAIPRESALNTMINAFGLTKESADSMLSTIGNGFVPKETVKQ